jgi:hypothetical protein
MCILHIRRELILFKDNPQKFVNCSSYTPHSIFQNIDPLKSLGIVESEKFFQRILHSFQRIPVFKYLSVYGEYGEFRVVSCTQNRLRIREKNLWVHGEETQNCGYIG